MKDTITKKVTVRPYGDGYHARCEGHTASSTSSAQGAVGRAALKAFGVPFANGEFPDPANFGITLAPVDGRNWTAERLVQGEIKVNFEETKEAFPPWNRISDDSPLPDDNTAVLVHAPKCSDPVWMGYMEADEWYWIEGTKVPYEVTHWTHLPEPPKEGK